MTSTEPGTTSSDVDAAFDRFFAKTEPRLRRALMATYGLEAGREATAEAFAWAWEHRDDLEGLDYPVRYLYRVAQSRSRRRKVGVLQTRNDWAEPWVEPELMRALRKLSQRQRVAVVLVHGYAWTLAEVAELLGLKVTTVQTHLERGLARLRSHLEVVPDDGSR